MSSIVSRRRGEVISKKKVLMATSTRVTAASRREACEWLLFSRTGLYDHITQGAEVEMLSVIFHASIRIHLCGRNIHTRQVPSSYPDHLNLLLFSSNVIHMK
jgi:hypothetical protein